MDVEGRAATRELLRALHGDGVTVLLTSHDLADVEQTADRLAILDRGRIVALGSPQELASGAAARVRFRLATPLSQTDRVDLASRLRDVDGAAGASARRRGRGPLRDRGRGAVAGTRRRAGRLVRRARHARRGAAERGREPRGALPRARRRRGCFAGAADPRRRPRRDRRAGLAGDARDDRDGAAARAPPRRDARRDDRAAGRRPRVLQLDRHDPVRDDPAGRLPAAGLDRVRGDRDEPRQPRDHDRLRPLLRRPEAPRRVAAQPARAAHGEDRRRPRRRGRPGRAARRGRRARRWAGRRPPAPRGASSSSRCCWGRSRSPASGCCSPGCSGPRRCSRSRTSCSCSASSSAGSSSRSTTCRRRSPRSRVRCRRRRSPTRCEWPWARRPLHRTPRDRWRCWRSGASARGPRRADVPLGVAPDRFIQRTFGRRTFVQ